jgi:hypothetical protein
VKKGLCLALSSQSRETCKKYVTFFLTPIFLLFGADSVKAATVEPITPDIYQGATIAISATVSLTEEFSYLIRKNSKVTSSERAFVLGEEVTIRISLRAGKSERLSSHHVAVRIFNIHQQEVAFILGQTDVFGQVDFPIMATELFLGKNTVVVADMTYDKPIFLMTQLHFIVYETRDAKEKAEKDAGNGMVLIPLAEAPDSFDDGLYGVGNSLRKNATIPIYQFVGKSSRAGPP